MMSNVSFNSARTILSTGVQYGDLRDHTYLLRRAHRIIKIQFVRGADAEGQRTPDLRLRESEGQDTFYAGVLTAKINIAGSLQVDGP